MPGKPGCFQWSGALLPKPEVTDSRDTLAEWLWLHHPLLQGSGVSWAAGWLRAFPPGFFQSMWVVYLIWDTLHWVPGALGVARAGPAGAFGVQQPHLSRWKTVTSAPELCSHQCNVHVTVLDGFGFLPHHCLCSTLICVSCSSEQQCQS